MRATLPKLLLLSTSFLFTNCSSYVAPESVVDKMARFKSQHTNINPVPAIALWKVTKPNSKTVKRMPKVHGKKPSPKTLYFTALYKQHSEFKSYMNDTEENTLNHCPAFHNTFIKIKKPYSTSAATKKDISKSKVISLSIDAPLYSLPIDNMTRTISSAIKVKMASPDVINKAIEAHTTRTLLELKEFCDTGTSENYYNFANVITHVQNNKAAFHREKESSMKSLLKTTVYSNLAILKNLDQVAVKGRFPASSNKKSPETLQDVDNALEVNWAASYFDSL